MTLKRVVITGLGTINPLGHNVAEFWENLKGGVSGAGPITRFDASKFRTQFACEVKNYEPTAHFDRKEVRKMDLYTQFGIIAAREAIKDAGLDFEKENKMRGLCPRGRNPQIQPVLYPQDDRQHGGGNDRH